MSEYCTAKDVMQPVPVSFDIGTPLIDVLEAMDEKGVSFAVITGAGERLAGIITLTDIIRRVEILGRGDWIETDIVEKHMTRELVLVLPTEDCNEIVRKLAKYHQVIVEAGMKAQGIITQNDIERWLVKSRKKK